MVPEGQTHVRRASPRVAAYASRAGAGHCPENVRLSTARRRLARLRHPINAKAAHVVRAGVNASKRRFNYRSNGSPAEASGRSPAAGRATAPRRTSSEDTESPGRVIPLIQSILIRRLLKKFSGSRKLFH